MKKRIVQASKYLGLAAGLLFGGGVVAAPAMADTIRFDFSGEVDHVGTQLSPPTPPFNTSSTMLGSMTVNTTDGNPNNNRGSYQIESFTVTIGGYTATFGPLSSGQVEIRNVPGGDRFDVALNNLITGNSVPSLLPSRFEIDLRGPNTLFNNDDLPGPGSLPPGIGAFTVDTEWRLLFGQGGGSRTVRGDMESLTAVPLPASVILFGLGLVALIGLGAGGLRNIRVPQI